MEGEIDIAINQEESRKSQNVFDPDYKLDIRDDFQNLSQEPSQSPEILKKQTSYDKTFEINFSKSINPLPTDEIDEAIASTPLNQPGKELIVLRNVHKTYLLGIEGVTALRGVSLTILEREFICILGTSGGGKTTLLNMIGTIDKPTKGEVYIAGQRIKSTTQDKILASLRLNHLAFVFQTFNLLGSLTALENVELPMILKGELSKSEIRKTAISLLERVGLKERINHFPNQLSGGEQQRVTIARALSNKPKILLLDEPTGDLDTKNSDLIMEIIVDLNVKEGITVIMVTHDVALKQYANRVVRMLDGKINKIEEHSPYSRQHAIYALKKTTASYRHVAGASHRLSDSPLGVREGVQKAHEEKVIRLEEVNSETGKPKFEIRKKEHYPALAFIMNKQAQ